MRKPDWLPEMLSETDNWNEIEDKAYDIFWRDFVENQTYFEGKPVVFNNDIELSEKNRREKTFYHLIKKTQTKRSKRKIEDRKRAVRIGWIKPIIQNSDNAEITKWDYFEPDGSVRTYLWLKSLDFLVILENNNGSYFLVTSFFVEKLYRISLEQKYLKRVV